MTNTTPANLEWCDTCFGEMDAEALSAGSDYCSTCMDADYCDECGKLHTDEAGDLLTHAAATTPTTQTFTVTYSVVLEVRNGEERSLNNAIDAVSLALWSIGQDRDDFQTTSAELRTAQEGQENCARCINISDDEVVRSYE